MPSAAEVWYTCVKILRLAVFGCWGWFLWPWQLDKEKEGEARRPGFGSLPAVWPGQSTSPFLAIGSPGKREFNDMRCCIPNVAQGLGVLHQLFHSVRCGWYQRILSKKAPVAVNPNVGSGDAEELGSLVYRADPAPEAAMLDFWV